MKSMLIALATLFSFSVLSSPMNCEVVDASQSTSYSNSDYVVMINGYEFAGYSGKGALRSAMFLMNQNATVSQICTGKKFECAIKIGGSLPGYSRSNVGILIGKNYVHAAWSYDSMEDYWVIRGPVKRIREMVKAGICTFSL